MNKSHEWTFFTNHAHVMVCLLKDPEQSLREVAQAVGITERAVQRIIGELVDAGYLSRSRKGRCNQYTIHTDKQLRHPLESHHTLADVLDVITR